MARTLRLDNVSGPRSGNLRGSHSQHFHSQRLKTLKNFSKLTMSVEAEFNGIATAYVNYTLSMVFKNRAIRRYAMP